MRKSLLTLGLASLALTSFGATRVLYEQNFETVASPEAAGWTYGGTSISIASDAFGKFLELSQGQVNGRSAQVTWGQEIFMDKEGNPVLEDGTYTLQYDFAIIAGSNNQYNSEFTVFTNHAPIDNNKYFLPWSQKEGNRCWENWLIDMNCNEADKAPFQFYVDSSATETTNDAGEKEYTLDTTTGHLVTFSEGTWYTVTLNVNVNDRTVDYSIVSLDGTDTLVSDTRTVPENDVNGDPISMYAEGLFILVARYATIYDIDNIKIYFESEKDYANPPTIALTRLGKTAEEEENLNLRAYTITFIDGETLHVEGTDGTVEDIDYADCEGAYVYETTKSGVLKAWTTSGEATSDVVEVEVECTPCVLPVASATISSVSAGYGKTYTLTVSNEEVPLRPTIFIDYKFVGNSGNVIEAEGAASGIKVTVEEEGTLTVTTAAFGYEAASTTVTNDLEFETKTTWDFARMTEEQVKAAGFPDWSIENSGSTSGFTNWSGRKRLYYTSSTETTVTTDEEGNEITVPATILPFGFVSAESETQVIKYAVIDRAAIPETTKGEYFEGLTIFPERGKVDEGGLPNVGMIYHIGLYNDQTKNNNNNVYINDLDPTDFVVVNYINNYGGNSNHPVCATDEEYYAQLAGEDAVISVASEGTLNEETGLYDAVYALYRIDTAITKITVYKQAGVNAVEAIESVVAGDNNWYSIDGVRVAEPTRPGLYIHGGKKVIVK